MTIHSREENNPSGTNLLADHWTEARRLRILHSTFDAIDVLLSPLLGQADERQDDWSRRLKLPSGEKTIELFNGHDLAGWDGMEKYFSVIDHQIRAANEEPVIRSTYLFTKQKFDDFRLLLEVKQTMGEKYSTMHSSVAAFGKRVTDPGGDYGFHGLLFMFCHDWGIWDAGFRGRVFPPDQKVPMADVPWEKQGEWNQLEILVIGNHIRIVANGQLIVDHTETVNKMEQAPIALQLHDNQQPQEFHFRGLLIVENPTDQLITLKKQNVEQ